VNDSECVVQSSHGFTRKVRVTEQITARSVASTSSSCVMAVIWYSSFLGGYSSFRVHESMVLRICCVWLCLACKIISVQGRMFSMFGVDGVDCLKLCPPSRFHCRCCSHLRRQPRRLFPQCVTCKFQIVSHRCHQQATEKALLESVD
jgi:hypothetical protein